MDDMAVAKVRIAEGNWSPTGWDQDPALALSWVEDIEDRFHGNPQLAIDRVHADLIEQLEKHPKRTDSTAWECREEDIEFLTYELARLISMRDHLFNWSPSEAWLAREMNAG